MGKINKECIKNKQNVKTLECVGEDKKRKPSSESKNKIQFKLPQKRTTRLKSEIFEDGFRGDSADDDYDTTKQNFNSSKFKPLREKAKLSKSYSIKNETMNEADLLLDSATKTKDQIKRGGGLKKSSDKIITTGIDGHLNDLDDQTNGEESNNVASSKRRRKQSESTISRLDKSLNDKADDDHEESQFELVVTPAPESKKVIQKGSSDQVLDISGNENVTLSHLNDTRKVIIPKTENGYDMTKTNKISEQNRKSIVEMSEESSSKKNSIKNTDMPVQANNGCRNTTILNNSTIEINNKKQLDSESPEKNNKVLRNGKNIQMPQTVEKFATLSEKRNTRSEKQISIQSPHMSTGSSNLNGIKKTVPKKKGKPQSIKKRYCNENLKSCQIKCTKLSKLTKKQIEHVGTKKIPKKRLDEVLDMFNNDQHPNWEDRNISCKPSIHNYWEPSVSLVSDQNIKVKYARQFLLRKDWLSLSKVLCLSSSTAKLYYPLLSKYAALLLAYTDKEQFDKFVQFLTSITDSSTVLKKCTTITKENEE